MRVRTAPETRYQLADRKSCFQNSDTLIINRTVITDPMNAKAAIFGVQFLNPMPFPAESFCFQILTSRLPWVVQ